MVRERIQTAWILEDDVDWDVMIKAQLTEFARGTRHLLKASPDALSPYGDGWDLLATGHCGMQNFNWLDQNYWVSDNDPTVVPDSERTFWRKPDLSAKPLQGKYSRMVMAPHKFTCLGSYAMSIQGAARVLYDQSVQPNGREIDTALSTYCRRRSYGNPYQCLAPYPMITGIYRPAGSKAKDSDRSDKPPEQFRAVPFAQNLMYSVRINSGILLHGSTAVTPQFPEAAMLKEIDVATLRIPQGGPVFVTPDDYEKKAEGAITVADPPAVDGNADSPVVNGTASTR